MKKLYAIFLILVSAIAFAQTPCIPDASYTQAGIYPPPGSYTQADDIFLPTGNVNAYYEQTIQIVVPTDTVIDTLGTQFSATIDSFVLVNVNNLPNGLNYICDNSNCTWPGGSNGCITIYGTPTVQGSFNIDVVIDGYVQLFGVPINQVETLDMFWVPVDYGVGLAEEEIDFSIYPNPSNGRFNLELNRQGTADIEVLDMVGRTVYTGTIEGSQVLNLEELNSGMYTVKVSQDHTHAIQRVIVE
jgi:hypothetical protein